MEMERLRQTHAKEVESRDEEVEEIRQSCQKKVGLARGPAAPWGSGYILGAAWAVVTQRSEPTRPLPSSSRAAILPLRSMLPLVGYMISDIALSKVDFPAPLVPMIPSISPLHSSNVTLSTAMKYSTW